MAKRPVPGKQVDIESEAQDHGMDLAGTRSSRPPPARPSRPPKPVQTFPAAQSEPTPGFTGTSLEDAMRNALSAPHQAAQGGF